MKNQSGDRTETARGVGPAATNGKGEAPAPDAPRRRLVDRLFEDMDRLAAVDMEPLSDDVVVAEVKAVRAERRATHARGG